jgi:uncharacterized protein YqhQ
MSGASGLDAPIPAAAYGGQAVVEGVMIRGRHAMAIAARRPDGSIAIHAQRLGGLLTGPLRRVPLLRGVLALWETIALGVRALSWSSAVADNRLRDADSVVHVGRRAWAGALVSLLGATVIFFLGPVLLTSWLTGPLPAPWLAVVAEGLLRVSMVVGYTWAIGRTAEVRRLFQYHGAEHMTIAALEHGRGLTIPAIRRESREHPRCGTSFLLTVAVVAGLVFLPLGAPPLPWWLASRVALVPLVAAIAYEAIRFAGAHPQAPFVRWAFWGNLSLQRLTTREPNDEQIQVAVAALERARAEDARHSALPPRPR